MFLKKNIISLSILGTVLGLSSCSTCEQKDSITLHPYHSQTQVRFPLNKGEASVGVNLSYSVSERTDCELKNVLGDDYTEELIVGHTRQAVGERLQHKKFDNLSKSCQWQEKKLTKELANYFSCFGVHILSVELDHLHREADCVLKASESLVPGCYDYAGVLKEKE